jgi:hypothetical protein
VQQGGHAAAGKMALLLVLLLGLSAGCKRPTGAR